MLIKVLIIISILDQELIEAATLLRKNQTPIVKLRKERIFGLSRKSMSCTLILRPEVAKVHGCFCIATYVAALLKERVPVSLFLQTAHFQISP